MGFWDKVIPGSLIPGVYITKEVVEPLIDSVNTRYQGDWSRISTPYNELFFTLVQKYQSKSSERFGKYNEVMFGCKIGKYKTLTEVVLEIVHIDIYDTPKKKESIPRHLDVNFNKVTETLASLGVPDSLIYGNY